ncbi:MAG: CYTH and CHAD domain-containing protein [Acidimicrobiales bacterium]
MTRVVARRSHLEREVKLGVDLDFVLPDLTEDVGTPGPPMERAMRTAYFDTAEFRLWRRGMTLRHRAGEEPGAGTWTAKVPAPSEGPTLDRTELSWAGPREALPEEAIGLFLGITRSSPLHQIVELVTTRRRFLLAGSAGVPGGELDDDTVTVSGGNRDGVCFRQIEVEFGPGGDVLGGRVVNRLLAAGARPGGEQKLAKAVDLPARSRQGARIHKGSRMADVAAASIAAALDRLLDNDYLLRLDPSNPSVEGIHQARVATRRLRSELKLIGSVLDPVWVAQVRAELRWLGRRLGTVRDADVLAVVLSGAGDGSPFDAGGRRELRSAADAERRGHCRDLSDALSSDRYLELLDRLDAAAELPPFAGGRRGKRASSPAGRVLPKLVRYRWRSLRRAVRRGGRHPSDAELHGMRIRAKELRYAAETAAPVVGKAARRTATAAEEAQNVLGRHHDAVSAEAWLRNQAAKGTPAGSYSAGRLAAEQARSQRRLRRRWRPVWRRLDQKNLRRWFSPRSSDR